MPRPSDNLTVVHDAAGNLVWSDVLRGARPPMSVDDARRRLDELGLGEVGARSIPQLSGGEQMRLAFACAAVGDPRSSSQTSPRHRSTVRVDTCS
ncbi:MAG: hypothetical protein R2697_08545 [Ilumatobacteraceae bacterium]